MRGSIAPLIELGAGLDPRLTAGENIFLNGALLGHSKRYMQEHFDEIVEFADLGNFLDMPIKIIPRGCGRVWVFYCYHCKSGYIDRR